MQQFYGEGSFFFFCHYSQNVRGSGEVACMPLDACIKFVNFTPNLKRF